MRYLPTVDQFAEVLVKGDNETLLFDREAKNILVRHATVLFSHPNQIITTLPKCLDNTAWGMLINQQSHLSGDLENLFVGNQLVSIEQSGSHIVACEVIIGVDLLNTGSMHELLKNHLDGNAGSSDDRLATKHPGIEFNSRK